LKYRIVVCVVTSLLAVAAFAQQKPSTPPPEEQPLFGFWLKGHAMLFNNFFQAAEGTPQDDVRAGLAEVGASLRLTPDVRGYASYNYLHYDEEELDHSDGIRVGARKEGAPHAFDVYAEQLNNRPSFDVGDTFDRADVRTFAGEYSYRFLRDWQASVDGELQHQSFEVTEERDNDFQAVGAAIRYRGWRMFSPEVGFRRGERDVDDATQSYDQRDLYLQIRSSLSPAVYLSLRYRDRTREYATGLVTSPNFGREDKRRQVLLAADWTTSEHLTWNFYYSQEDVDVNQPGRDFDTSLLLAGLTWKF
jgi:hypothetical protein